MIIGYKIIDDFLLEIEPVELIDAEEKIKKYIDDKHVLYKCKKIKILLIKNIFTQEFTNTIKFNGKFINYTISDTQIFENEYIKCGDIILEDPNTDSSGSIYFLNENDMINWEFSFDTLVKKYAHLNLNWSCEYKKYNQKTGVLQKIFYHNNGIKQGEYKEYYENSNINLLCNYVSGILHGEYISYLYDHFDNLKIYKKQYVNGVNNGDNIIEEYYIGDDKKDLISRELCKYENNKIVGPRIKYNFYDNNDNEKITSTEYSFYINGEEFLSFTINNNLDEKKELLNQMLNLINKS